MMLKSLAKKLHKEDLHKLEYLAINTIAVF